MHTRLFRFSLLVIVAASTSCLAFGQESAHFADSLLNFIMQNKARSSVYLRKNDTTIAKLNDDKIMPLASTVKMVIAVEFAKQAGNKIINKDGYISIRELEKYYLQNTDGQAHPSWLRYERTAGHIKNDSVKMIDIAKGMIMFSSNANAEFLMDTLGFDNINSNLPLLNITKHTLIYPLVASLMMYQNPNGLKESDILEYDAKLTEQQYAKFAIILHRRLKNNPSYKLKFRPQDLTVKMQKAWSDRLPSSTTRDYVNLCAILNNRKFFDSRSYAIISEVLETVMQSPANKAIFIHAGMKGGSTMFVLTKALYATLKNGTRIEMAYFFNDLNSAEVYKLQKWMNEFELNVLTNDSFRANINFQKD